MYLTDTLGCSDPSGNEAVLCLWSLRGINSTSNSPICIYLVGWNSCSMLGRELDIYRER